VRRDGRTPARRRWRDGRGDTGAARWVGRDLSGAMGKKMLVDVDGLVQVRVHVRVHVLDHVIVNATGQARPAPTNSLARYRGVRTSWKHCFDQCATSLCAQGG